MKKLVLTGVLLFAALLFAGAQQGYAYDNVTSSPDGGCLACHPGFAGGSGAGHTTHSGVTGSCGACHPGSVPGKNVKSSTCIVCHPAGNVGACNLVVAHQAASSSCITCHPTCTPPPANQAACADWVGDWKWTYDNATTTKICFDNESIVDGAFDLCDNESKDNCTCLDNITSQQFCIDNATFAQCNPDNYSGSDKCVCVGNPFYKAPGPNGIKDVTITQAVDNLTLFGNSVPCTASGTRGTTPVTVIQVDNASATELGIAPLTYIVFEGADFDNATFAEILPAKFTKDNDSTQFTAETLFNSIGLVSGVKNDNGTTTTTTIPCEPVKVFPKTFRKVIAIVDPFQIYVIRAERSSAIEFSRPIDIDWETEAINDLVRIRLGKKLIFGIIFVRPFKLEPGDFTVTVTYGDNETKACGPITVK